MFDYMRYSYDDPRGEFQQYYTGNIDPTARPLAINLDYNQALTICYENLQAALNGENRRMSWRFWKDRSKGMPRLSGEPENSECGGVERVFIPYQSLLAFERRKDSKSEYDLSDPDEDHRSISLHLKRTGVGDLFKNYPGRV